MTLLGGGRSHTATTRTEHQFTATKPPAKPAMQARSSATIRSSHHLGHTLNLATGARERKENTKLNVYRRDDWLISVPYSALVDAFRVPHGLTVDTSDVAGHFGGPKKAQAVALSLSSSS